jgi:hypothetical protein
MVQAVTSLPLVSNPTHFRVVFSDGSVWHRTGTRDYCEGAVKQWNEMAERGEKRAFLGNPVVQT